MTGYWLAWLYDQIGGRQTVIWTGGGSRAPRCF